MRHFCMLDTQDTLQSRIVINIETRNDVNQAIAENINPGLTRKQRIEHAKKTHADYITGVWVLDYDTADELFVDVRTGVYTYRDKKYSNENKWISVNEGAFKQQRCNLSINDLCVKRGAFHICQDKYIITNTDSRPEFYKRSKINSHIHVCKVKFSNDMYMYTSSRRCICRVTVNHEENLDMSGWSGVLIKQSDDNKRDHLKHVV